MRVPFDLLLFTLAGLQFATIVLLIYMATQLSWTTMPEIICSLVNIFAIKVVVGTSSSFSGIVVAHELIHRSNPVMHTLGRLLLSLECYEHFATEHIRGHHKNVGTNADPATARLGESYEAFWKRTISSQFRSAWQLENKRLGITESTLYDHRLFYHHVAQGLIFELLLLVTILWLFGIVALLVFLMQAYAAVRKLETVNYIQHWGLTRNPEHGNRVLSWDTDSWFTLNTLVGLSRHSDHHKNAARPFHKLCYRSENPKLPYGYFTLVFLSVFSNKQFQKLVNRQLHRYGLKTHTVTTLNFER